MTTRDNQLPDAHRGRTAPELASTDVRMATNRENNWIAKAVKGLFRFPYRAGLRAIWLELYSLCSRIAFLRNNNWLRYGTWLRMPVQQVYRQRVPQDKYQQLRTRGIQIMLSNPPVPSPCEIYKFGFAIDLLWSEGYLNGVEEPPRRTYDKS